MKTILPRLDIYATDYCNFNCSNCLTYCRHNKKTENCAEDYIEHLKYLQTYADIELLHILGGEPTLHSNLEDFVIKIRAILNPKTKLEIISNGWWMPNEDRFANIWTKVDKLGQGIHPELLDRLSLDEIRACMSRIRKKYNIITDLYLDSSFSPLCFTDINNKGITTNCRFNRCTALLPDGRMLRDGNINYIPENIASLAFNKAKKNTYYNIYSGSAESLATWRNTTPECCQYCTGDTIKVPHFGYETTVLQEYKYPGDE